MSYLGNSPEVQNYTLTIDKFNGDGACTVFTLSRLIDDAIAVEVLVNDVQQTPFDSYTVSAGVITFSAAPSIGSNNIVAITRATTIFTKTQVGTADIQDGAITAAKIADGTVVAAEIANGAVTGPKLGQTAINANNIVDGAVTGDKIGLTAINANNIVDGAVTGNKLGQTAINANNIVDGAVTGPKLGLTSINANNIVDGSVTVVKGGTGLSTLTANSVVVGNGTDAVQLLAPGTTGNVLTSNGTNWVSQAAAAGGGDYIMQVFTTPGTWTKAAGLKAVKVTVIGGGGATSANPGNSAGGTSSFGSPAFLSATGGGAGSISPVGGAGGAGSGGQLNSPGAPASVTFVSGCIPFSGQLGGSSAFGFGPFSQHTTGRTYGGGAGGQFTPAPAASSGAGGGGGAIEYIDAPALPGPQPYTVGAGGTVGPGPQPGFNGAAGVIIVEEFY
jgi:hypothetical protein